jgi:hypothetical protein
VQDHAELSLPRRRRYDRLVVTVDTARSLALAHPETSELPHHGLPSFRVRGRIFATIPDGTHMNVMPGEAAIRAVAATRPADCAERWWGRRLAALTINLEATDVEFVREMLQEAWHHKAALRRL